MKIRIKGNSIRLRLTKTDVRNLKEVGLVIEKTVISEKELFIYELKRAEQDENISAYFQNGRMVVSVSEVYSKILTETEEISIHHYQRNGEGEKDDLYLLVEKDLKCLDATFEDQSDMYDNPKTSC